MATQRVEGSQQQQAAIPNGSVQNVQANPGFSVIGNVATLSQEQLDAVRRTANSYLRAVPVTETQLREDFIKGAQYVEKHTDSFLKSVWDLGSNLFKGAGEMVKSVCQVGTFTASQLKDWVVSGGLKEAVHGAANWCFGGGLVDFIKSAGTSIGQGLVNAGKWIADGGIQKALGAAYEWVASGKFIDWITSPETWKALGMGVLSMTGLLSLYNCGQALMKASECLKKGDIEGAKAQLLTAAIEGVMGVVGVVSTVAAVVSLGSSLSVNAGLAAAKITVKDAVVEGAEAIAKEASKEIVERTTQAISTQVLEKLGAECAKAGMATFKQTFTVTLEAMLQKQVAVSGAKSITEEFVKRAIEESLQKALVEAGLKAAMQQTTQKAVEEMLGKHQVERIVAEECGKVLQQTAAKDVATIAEQLAKAGVEHSKLKAAALKRALLNGSMDTEIKKVFEDTITKDLKESLMERGLRKGFEKGLEAELQSMDDEAIAIARKYGVQLKQGIAEESKAIIRTEAREGFEAGVEAAVRNVVRKGIERAFKREERDDDNQRPLSEERKKKEKKAAAKQAEYMMPEPVERAGEIVAISSRQMEKARAMIEKAFLPMEAGAVKRTEKVLDAGKASIYANWDGLYKGGVFGLSKEAVEAQKLKEVSFDPSNQISRGQAREELVMSRREAVAETKVAATAGTTTGTTKTAGVKRGGESGGEG